jgi:hypothetical protein
MSTSGENIPHYAILSHRWESQELTVQDFRDKKGPGMIGWRKVCPVRTERLGEEAFLIISSESVY